MDSWLLLRRGLLTRSIVSLLTRLEDMEGVEGDKRDGSVFSAGLRAGEAEVGRGLLMAVVRAVAGVLLQRTRSLLSQPFLRSRSSFRLWPYCHVRLQAVR